MIFGEFHCHTNYCDGKNTPREMVEEAVKRGLPALGITGHGYMPHDGRYCMTKEDTKQYIKDITALKSEFSDRIDLLLGLEADLFTEFDKSKFDYIIGSCHYYEKDGVLFDVDGSAEETLKAIELFRSADALAEYYFEQVSTVKNKLDCQIVGHFDLLTKFEEKQKLFDTESKRYVSAALSALDELLKTDVLFEVNSGAISRGYRTTPYPAPFILKHIKEKNGSIILTGDAHSKETLCAYFDDMLEYVKSIGFKTVKTLSKEGIKEISI